MQNNVGPTDRTVRIVVGVVMIALRFFGPVAGFLGGLLVLVGAYLLVTAAIGYCPVYHLFRYSTTGGERVALGGPRTGAFQANAVPTATPQPGGGPGPGEAANREGNQSAQQGGQPAQGAEGDKTNQQG